MSFRPMTLLAAAAVIAAAAAPLTAAVKVGDVAPEITPTATWNANGKTKLSDFRGEYVHLVFWATW
jgi:hypothetical protein